MLKLKLKYFCLQEEFKKMYESQRLREETLAELHQEEAEDVTQYTEGILFLSPSFFLFVCPLAQKNMFP